MEIFFQFLSTFPYLIKENKDIKSEIFDNICEVELRILSSNVTRIALFTTF